MKNAEIAVLVERVQANKEAFEDLYKQVWKVVYYHCYKTLGNKQDAEDAMQTVFIALHKNIDTLRHPAAFNKFLHTTIRYTCNDFRKAIYRNTAEDIQDYDTSLFEENAEFLPAKAYENEAMRNQIAKLVETLPEKQQEAILLFYYDEKSVKEIAEITESKLDAVKNRLVAARKTLKERAGGLMAITPVPLLTQILQGEALQVATPEIGQVAWAKIAEEIGFTSSSTGGQGGTAAASSASTAVGINVAIAVAIVAVVGAALFGAYYVNETFVQLLVAATDYYGDEPLEETITIEEFIPRIRAITTRNEFVDFIQTYGFRLIGGNRSNYDGDQVLYFLEHESSFIYLGYVLSLEGDFRVVYEITDNTMPRVTSEEVKNWFFAR